MNVVINVNRYDIVFGVRLDSEECPIVQAIRRAVPFAMHVAVYNSTVVISAMRHWQPVEWGCRLPKKARMFIRRFDALKDKRPAEPFSFTLDVPERLMVGTKSSRFAQAYQPTFQDCAVLAHNFYGEVAKAREAVTAS